MADTKVTAIVLAAGQGKRMNSNIQKQFMLINERPVLYYPLKAFDDSSVDEIIVVTGEAEIEYCKTEIVEKYGFAKVKAVVAGGKERYDSVYNGLKASKCDYVLIHDGARPLINADIIERTIAAVKEYDACTVGMPVKDTIKISDDNDMVASTPSRKYVWQIQTPQAFKYELIMEAHEKRRSGQVENANVTDDSMLVEELMNHSVKLVSGSYSNMKVTTPEDILIAEILLKNEA